MLPFIPDSLDPPGTRCPAWCPRTATAGRGRVVDTSGDVSLKNGCVWSARWSDPNICKTVWEEGLPCGVVKGRGGQMGGNQTGEEISAPWEHFLADLPA